MKAEPSLLIPQKLTENQEQAWPTCGLWPACTSLPGFRQLLCNNHIYLFVSHKILYKLFTLKAEVTLRDMPNNKQLVNFCHYLIGAWYLQ